LLITTAKRTADNSESDASESASHDGLSDT